MRRLILLPLAVVALALAGCGATAHGSRQPTRVEHSRIVRAIDESWRHDPAFAAVRTLNLHPAVASIRISQRDAHFAVASIAPLDRYGKQSHENAQVGLMEIGGNWRIVIGPGTEFALLCKASSPRPFVDLFCR